MRFGWVCALVVIPTLAHADDTTSTFALVAEEDDAFAARLEAELRDGGMSPTREKDLGTAADPIVVRLVSRQSLEVWKRGANGLELRGHVELHGADATDAVRAAEFLRVALAPPPPSSSPKPLPNDVTADSLLKEVLPQNRSPKPEHGPNDVAVAAAIGMPVRAHPGFDLVTHVRVRPWRRVGIGATASFNLNPSRSSAGGVVREYRLGPEIHYEAIRGNMEFSVALGTSVAVVFVDSAPTNVRYDGYDAGIMKTYAAFHFAPRLTQRMRALVRGEVGTTAPGAEHSYQQWGGPYGSGALGCSLDL
jgi:hypothetical protein